MNRLKTTMRPVLSGLVLPVFLAATVYGCQDFLTEAAKPKGTLNEQTLANRNGVEGSLIAAYRALDWNNGVGGGWGNSASNWIWASITSDDAYKGTEASDGPNMADIETYQWSTPGAEGLLNEKWRGMYEGVVRSNATLRLVKQVGELSADEAKGITGEALFLRAHYHFEAWRLWGNIPYYFEEDADFRKANLTSDQVVVNILKDLDSAIVLLPTSPRRNQVGRATKWTARAYKGRLLVYTGQFAAALPVLREIRTSGPYALEASYDRVWTGFAQFANGKETIFAYQASSNDGEPNGNNANYGERLNFPHSGSPFGCCGFHQPSQNLVNFFVTDANGLPISLSNANWNARDAEMDAARTARAGDSISVDTRLDFTVGRDGVPYKDWGTHEVGWIRAPAYGGPYSPRKNVHEKASGAQQTAGGWAPTQQNSVNIHLFRYADLLLLLAEAEVEQNNIEAARTIVNEVRARAAAKAQGPGTDAATIAVAPDDARITWAKYNVGQYTAAQFGNQAQARERVRTERRLELAMEGQRFWDLRRWGNFEAVLNAYLNVEKNRRNYLASAQAVQPRHRWYPIPQTQIELSRLAGQTESNLKQNTGW